MIQEDFAPFDTLKRFFEDTFIGDFLVIKGDIRLLEKTLKSTDKELEAEMRERSLYWSDRINTYLKSMLGKNLDEDTAAKMDFLFENKEEAVLIICCLEDTFPELPLRESGEMPPFLFVHEENLETLRKHIDEDCGHSRQIKETWTDFSDDDFWFSLRAALNEAIDLEQSSIYSYAAEKKEMDPYHIMEDGYAVGTSTCTYILNPVKQKLVALDFVCYRPLLKRNENEESEHSDVDEDFF